ncbi:hypothetical protein BDR05DRAFT_892470, partial [Suillus weaverae]
LAQRFALDAIRPSIIRHSFNYTHTGSQFVADYNRMMHDIGEPLCLVAPFLERIFPRRKMIRRMDRLYEGSNNNLDAKCSKPGEGIMTMLKHPELSGNNFSIMAALFLAGHVCDQPSTSVLLIAHFETGHDVRCNVFVGILLGYCSARSGQ